MPDQSHSHQSSAPQPRSILRGHKAQVHVATFVRGNKRLITGDTEGFVIVWDLTIMRPRAVWRAHQKAILNIREWGLDKLITHGRDHEIIVWRLTEDDESKLAKSLPVQGVPDEHPRPWVQHVMPVNSMNFCAFSACERSGFADVSAELLIAAPNAVVLEAVDIFQLPDQTRLHTVKPDAAKGMPMALSLFELSSHLHLIATYEDGLATVSRLDPVSNKWSLIYQHQAHSQPILSLDLAPSREYFLTSGADAIIAKHPVPGLPHPPENTNPDPTGSTAQNQSAPMTAHGIPAGSSGLAAMFAKSTAPTAGQASHPRVVSVVKDPLKVVNTKHSGQQSLRIRSDGIIFATAGWDSRVRVYSAKSLKEIAVLKWHQTGCYATAFASVAVEAELKAQHRGGSSEDPSSAATTAEDGSLALVQATMMDLTVKERRVRHAQGAHWLAAGGKDGKISLWDVY